ncbi:MAG: tRNA pseudouridine(55) synthase TruB [Candidatus Accumulibacter sp.]|nr:tRNA pseudouridine(55) synthase TruB [Accumulibacter sp.]
MTNTNAKPSWKRVDGVLLLDKDEGLSSNHALQKARRLYSAAKAGHTGTLDPLATGLLPVCFGEATKFSGGLLDADKAYEATLQFGVKTTTGDSEGEIVERREVMLSRDDVEAALGFFRGEIRQVPPMYSALKHGGEPLYRLARRGETVERVPRVVTIYALDLLDFSETSCRLRVRCSKGAYIRTLAEDIGENLSCGAHLTALRRTAVGDFCVADAATLADLAALGEDARMEVLKPVDALLETLPILAIDGRSAERFLHGNPIRLDAPTRLGAHRVYADGRFAGTGEVTPGGILQARRLVAA